MLFKQIRIEKLRRQLESSAMSARLAKGGHLIDRDSAFDFSFNGRRMSGFAGDTLASALLANSQQLVGRSFKYHRPRGIMASGVEEPNGLVTLGAGEFLEPNQRVTSIDLFDGLAAQSQNHWPSLEFDLGAASDIVSKLLPAGFYYKTFMQPRAAWERFFEPLIRRAAGLGPAPKERDPDTYEHFYAHVDILIVGGGLSGLAAARLAAATGVRTLVVEQSRYWGGRSYVDTARVDGRKSDEWVEETIEDLAELEHVQLRLRTTATGVYDHGYVLALERAADQGLTKAPRHRMWRIRAKKIIMATGAIERPLCFGGNDVPGVMLSSAVRDYVVNYGVSPGDRTVILTANDDAYRTATVLIEAGLSVPAILDLRPHSEGELANTARDLGIRVECAAGIASVVGRRTVRGVRVCSSAGEGATSDEIECDIVAMSGGWSPSVHLWSHCGGKVRWDERLAIMRPDRGNPPINSQGLRLVYPAGSAAGELNAIDAIQDAETAALALIGDLGLRRPMLSAIRVDAVAEQAPMAAWLVPNGLTKAGRSKAWVDFQNDVKVSDIEVAVREGYESVEHTKRYTTLGMATDQGKLSNVNGIALLSRTLGTPIGDVGTTTFRPPYTPVVLGAIAGDARGQLFLPTRKTPIDEWHASNGAFWEPVSAWRRPYCYQNGGESIQDAVNREALKVRMSVGILDASTLGKLLVKGPDAGKFLDMLYTNSMSTLKPGTCRYGLMCNENGFLIDDGVVARIDDETFLCHTTTGGADQVHAWMEEWLQCEWWYWNVFTANLTEQFAQICVAGPNARDVLEDLGGMDVSEGGLPFMRWKAGEVGGVEVRVFRVSFSGELSFEIAVPSNSAMEIWNAFLDVGRNYEMEPYGTEALHVLRAEVGFIMIGDETDGTVTPQDLGLDWAISKKKRDFIGKRAQERAFLVNPNRLRLVGLETTDPEVVLPSGAHAIGERRNVHGHPEMTGRVTSSYYSPILNRSIALGLVERGHKRMGEVLQFAVGSDLISTKVVDPKFYRPGAGN